MSHGLSLGFLLGVISMSDAHLCMLNPHQRGSMNDLNTAGTNDCFLIEPPCGKRLAELPQVVYEAGSNISVILQKNLNHWTSASPGYLNVSIMFEQGGISKEIGRVADKGEPSLHLYTVTGLVPKGVKGRAIIQASYITKNKAAPPAFYQCADIMIA